MLISLTWLATQRSFSVSFILVDTDTIGFLGIFVTVKILSVKISDGRTIDNVLVRISLIVRGTNYIQVTIFFVDCS